MHRVVAITAMLLAIGWVALADVTPHLHYDGTGLDYVVVSLGPYTIQGPDGAGGTEDWLVIDRTADPPLQAKNGARHQHYKDYGAQTFNPKNAAKEIRLNGIACMEFTDSAADTDDITFAINVEEHDLTEDTTFEVYFFGADATAADVGSETVLWRLSYRDMPNGTDWNDAAWVDLADAGCDVTVDANNADQTVECTIGTIAGGLLSGPMLGIKVTRADDGDTVDDYNGKAYIFSVEIGAYDHSGL